ncbi:alpha/beta hydrolase [Acinetobacter sp. NCu2D-2]|uniref:RBBP9/YdeN family alpha/beta hydrolase n=1 Tax=Acinetobacter sp. NCu2D-2 TaxID=1608473 RepID=UPI0007CDF3CA|nr:alpha/beta hydrolase [Acinetobacter sp. NCu2D-2]ANF81158.1 alpha/beta hydrolase [Acinetobacter sp. NCu2D-2]
MTTISKKIYIVHDYRANSNDHWYPWLSREIKSLGHQAKRIMLANPVQPNLQEWRENLALQIPKLDEHTILIGHGLSVLSLLDYLQDQYFKTSQSIQSLIMVAGFDQPVVAWSELNQAIRQIKLNYTQLQYAAERYVMFMSNNDPYIPAPHSLRLAHALNAAIIEQKAAGHFVKETGFLQFPELLDAVKHCLKNEKQSAVSL